MDDEEAQVRSVAVSLRVPFRDVDMHGHVHNAVYLSYCEGAINEFIRGHGFSEYFSPKEDGIVYLVRKTELLFSQPSFFEDKLDFVVALAKLGATSIAFTIDVFGAGETTSRVTASIVWVCVDIAQKKSTGIPQKTMAALVPLTQGGKLANKER